MYNRNFALPLAVASELAYGRRSPNNDSDITGLIGKYTTEMHVVGTAEVLFCIGVDDSIIAFRGSDSVRDWFANLAISKSSRSYGDVMTGFDDEAGALYAKCIEVYDGASNVYVTGHSKGAATGTCFLNRIILNRGGRKLLSAYFFGCPRSLGTDTAKRFSENYIDRIFRVENNNDIVCRAPTILRWRHTNREGRSYINHKGKLMLGMSNWEIFADQMKGRFSALLRLHPLDGFDDHGPMSKYVKLVRDN